MFRSMPTKKHNKKKESMTYNVEYDGKYKSMDTFLKTNFENL